MSANLAAAGVYSVVYFKTLDTYQNSNFYRNQPHTYQTIPQLLLDKTSDAFWPGAFAGMSAGAVKSIRPTFRGTMSALKWNTPRMGAAGAAAAVVFTAAQELYLARQRKLSL